MELFTVSIVIFLGLLFTYTNGFHDTANAIATVVGTKVLTPRQAIMLAAVTNLIGAFFGLAVAKTISSGIVDANFITQPVLICVLLSAIFWNLLTWWCGIPSSSTHALVGSLVGAARGGGVFERGEADDGQGRQAVERVVLDQMGRGEAEKGKEAGADRTRRRSAGSSGRQAQRERHSYDRVERQKDAGGRLLQPRPGSSRERRPRRPASITRS